MSELAYTLYGRPIAWARARHFTPKRMREEQARHKEAATLARPLDWVADSGAFALYVVAYVPGGRVGDTDNYAKLVMDALQGPAYENDSLVTKLVAERRIDRENPRTEVQVVRL